MFAARDRHLVEDLRGKYDAYASDVAVATFYFDSPTMLEYSTKPSLDWVRFFSQMGGLLGLCLGFSIASGVELVYWVVFRVWKEMRKADSALSRGRSSSVCKPDWPPA